MSARLAGVTLLALLAGCATAPANQPPAPALAEYAADPFAPVNLYLNANEQLAPQVGALVEHLAGTLAASGAFVRLDRGVQRWPLTIQARYGLQHGGEGAALRRVLSVLTLGLVPVRFAQTHTLVAQIFEEPELVAQLELSVPARNRVSLYDLAAPLRDERAAVEILAGRLLGEIAARRLVPRWNEFVPPPTPKKRRPEGRPT